MLTLPKRSLGNIPPGVNDTPSFVGRILGPWCLELAGCLAKFAAEISGGILEMGKVVIISGTGTPTMTAPEGSLYLRDDPSPPMYTALYVMQNTLWIAK